MISSENPPVFAFARVDCRSFWDGRYATLRTRPGGIVIVVEICRGRKGGMGKGAGLEGKGMHSGDASCGLVLIVSEGRYHVGMSLRF